MPEIVIVRQEDMQVTEADKDAARRVVFGTVDGLGEANRRRWRRFWSTLMRMEPGEMATIKTHKSRSGPFHRRHMAMEQAVYEGQERFELFDQFIYWIKVGAGWVTWAAGPAGGVVPIPKSISYASADDTEFREFHDRVVAFLRGPHAARYLWPHLNGRADEMMNEILLGYDE